MLSKGVKVKNKKSNVNKNKCVIAKKYKFIQNLDYIHLIHQDYIRIQ
jgi:hypothetical protein